MSLVNPILIFNCGSSSLKYALISADSDNRIEGLAESLGQKTACIKHTNEQGEKLIFKLANANHQQALQKVLQLIKKYKPVAVGHRVVHGGNQFSKAQLITEEVLKTLKDLVPLAPLHNPANILGIETIATMYPALQQVAVFDTAFHQTMPDIAYRYAIPKALYEEDHIRRYGFHGTSHAFVSERASELTYQTGKHGWITAHLGNGCSVSAVYDGKSLDTSMGLTPLEGVMMGSRSGDVDAGLHAHLYRTKGWSIDDIDTMLNKKSGLLGVSTISNDMREVEQKADEGHEDAKLAVEMFCYRIAKYIASLSCALPTLTGIVFTGGIGENADKIRKKIVDHLTHFPVKLDNEINVQLVRGAENSFHETGSPIELWVIPTDEELRIAQETASVLKIK